MKAIFLDNKTREVFEVFIIAKDFTEAKIKVFMKEIYWDCELIAWK